MLLIFNTSSAQISCGTPSPAIYRTFENAATSSIQSTAESLCVKVHFHIVRNSNGTGGLSTTVLPHIINKLNQYYNEHGIYFSSVGHDFIDNSSYVDLTQNEFLPLIQTNDKTTALNYYITESITTDADGSLAGTAIAIPSRRLVIRSDAVLTEVSPHEVGHCFNLLHTFEGTKPGTSGCAESVNYNYSNCSECGDKVCDTPADAGASVGQTGGYNPDMTNIMSTYPDRDHLTPGQAARIKVSIQNTPMLLNLTGGSCIAPTVAGSYNICGLNSYTYTLQNTSYPANWQVSTNLQILSSTDSSITVKAANNFINAQETVKAILPYSTIYKDIYIGTPFTYLPAYCPGVQDSYCDLRNAGATMPKGQTTTLHIEGIGTSSSGTLDWEWEKVEGQFTFVTYGQNGSNGNPQANGTKSLGQTANIQISPSASGNISFRTRARNACGWGSAKFYSYSLSYGRTFSITPNPARDRIYIQEESLSSDKNISSAARLEKTNYTIQDLYSNKVKSGSFIGNSAEIDVSSLEKGIYVLNLQTGSENITKKIAVQ